MPIYKDTHCNRIANRVGKEYGKKKKPKAKKKTEEKPKRKFKVKNPGKPRQVEVRKKKNPLAIGNEKGFAAYYGQAPAITTKDLLKNLGLIEPALVSKIMGDVPNQDVLVYDKYLPPGTWQGLGDGGYGYDRDFKLKKYVEEISKGRFDDFNYDNKWIPENTPHPFAGQPRPRDEFDDFASGRAYEDPKDGLLRHYTFESREEYIEAEKKSIRKERAPPEHNPFKRNPIKYNKEFYYSD